MQHPLVDLEFLADLKFMFDETAVVERAIHCVVDVIQCFMAAILAHTQTRLQISQFPYANPCILNRRLKYG